MTCKKILVVILFLISSILHSQPRDEEITLKMKHLNHLIGTWNVDAQLISKSGIVSKENGLYSVSWELDSTYFRILGQLTNTSTDKSRRFICWITYDFTESNYRNIYLFDNNSSYIVELGYFDEKNKIFHTSANLKLPEGGEENIRTELKLIDPNHLEYKNWAQSDDGEEFNDFNATLTRKNN